MKNEQIKKFIKDYSVYLKNNNHPIILDKNALAIYYDTNEREIRKVFSELRSEGIYFFNISKGRYALFNNDKDMVVHAEKYLHKILGQIKTMYFNDVVTLKPYIQDARLRNIIGQMSIMEFIGDENEITTKEE